MTWFMDDLMAGNPANPPGRPGLDAWYELELMIAQV
jgi:hypothetical protein